MKLNELPRLKHALDLLGLDNGGNVCGDAVIPAEWVARGQIAEDELLKLSPQDVETLVMGEHDDIQAMAERARAAHEFIEAAFDGGPLSWMMDPWRSIHDAREAEDRVQARGTLLAKET